MSVDNSVRCRNCRFVCHNKTNDLYFCRIRATVESNEVGEDYWCGEFKRKLIHDEDNRNLEPQKLVVRECGNCMHVRTEKLKSGDALPEHDKHFCTYNPPVIVMNENDHRAHTLFSSVDKESGCSKFRSREIVIEEEPQNVLTPGKRAITLGDS